MPNPSNIRMRQGMACWRGSGDALVFAANFFLIRVEGKRLFLEETVESGARVGRTAWRRSEHAR